MFLERGFGLVSMHDLAKTAGVARRTLYNQFATKEDIFREMLRGVSGQLKDAFPPGIEPDGDGEDVLRVVARRILELHKQPEYCGFLRMVVAFLGLQRSLLRSWSPKLRGYLAHMTSLGILDCRNPLLAAHQFMGMLNEPSLWPWMIGREGLPLAAEDVVETLRTFLQRYRLPQSKGNSKDDAR
ncbi:TetR/AcrR family transcriptional regulator [Rhizobium ruizarguesonis]|uniref:TetR/AcrR family transcriptional regulator n=1 Tax=Rhizobium ruizarguesonis TaxID=2081791 RepID=UPI001FE21570|nr:TetR/AcrR family transcriptional regulator [Rhizobium ruizarguesonis]